MRKLLFLFLLTIGLIVLLIGCDDANQAENVSQTVPDVPTSISIQTSPTEILPIDDGMTADELVIPNTLSEGEPALPSLIVYGGYSEFRELYDLLELDDESIEEYLNSDERYHPNGLRARVDIENLFVSILDLYFPYLEGIEAESTVLAIGYMEDGHAAEVPVYVDYEVNGIRYHFTLNASSNWGNRPGPSAEEVIDNWDEELDGQLEFLTEEDGVSTYFWQRPDDGRVLFILDVKGVYTIATAFNAEDNQTAINGILNFDFRPL